MTVLFEKYAGNDLAFPVIFAALFLAVVGGALFLTPRIAKWLDERRAKKPGFYDDMLEEDPGTKKKGDGTDDAD